MACVNWSMTNITRGVWVVEKFDGGEWVPIQDATTDAVLAVLNAPLANGDAPSKDTGRDLLQRCTFSLMMAGNYYLMLAEDAPTSILEWVPSAKAKPVAKAGASNILDRYEVSGRRKDPATIIHAKTGVDPDNPLIGVSQIASAGRLVLADHELVQAHHALLKAPVPGLILTVPDVTSPEAIKILREQISVNSSGEDRSTPTVLTGEVNAHSHGFSPKDLDTSAMSSLSESRVAALFGISPMVLGLASGLDSSTYSNYDTALEASVRNHLMPMGEILGAALTEQWLKPHWGMGDDYRLRLSFDDLPELQADVDSLHDRARENFKANLMDRAAALSMIGVEPMPEDEGVYSWMLAPNALPSDPKTQSNARMRREAERVP